MTAQVVEPAQLPVRPISPRPAWNLAVGALLGVLLGYAIALLRQVLGSSPVHGQRRRGTDVGLLGNGKSGFADTLVAPDAWDPRANAATTAANITRPRLTVESLKVKLATLGRSRLRSRRVNPVPMLWLLALVLIGAVATIPFVTPYRGAIIPPDARNLTPKVWAPDTPAPAATVPAYNGNVPVATLSSGAAIAAAQQQAAAQQAAAQQAAQQQAAALQQASAQQQAAQQWAAARRARQQAITPAAPATPRALPATPSAAEATPARFPIPIGLAVIR